MIQFSVELATKQVRHAAVGTLNAFLSFVTLTILVSEKLWIVSPSLHASSPLG